MMGAASGVTMVVIVAGGPRSLLLTNLANNRRRLLATRSQLRSAPMLVCARKQDAAKHRPPS